MIDRDASNAFVVDLPPTAARTSAEEAVQDLRLRGGVFVEAVRATRMAMVLTDPALPGNPIVFANESFLALSGYDMREVLGQEPYFLNGPETDPRDAARFRRALAEDHDETLQTIQYSKDGARMVVSLFLTALKDDDGRTLHHLLSWRDISRQTAAEGEVDALREAQAALRESEARYHALFEGSPAPFLVLAPDAPRFTIKDVNEAYLTATMRKREDVVGRPLFDAFPDNPEEPTIHGVSRLRASLERVLATRKSNELPGLKYDIARPDGTFEERWWSPINSPVLNEHGEVEAIIHNANDVTRERSAEEALRESQARQAFLLRFSDALRAEPNDGAVVDLATRMLAEELELDRCYATAMYWDEDRVEITREFRRPHLDPMPSPLRFSDFPEAGKQAMDRTLVFNDTSSDSALTDTDKSSLAAMSFGALLASPLRQGAGNPIWSLGAVSSQARRWTAGEVALVEEAAERTWAAAEAARADAAVRESEDRYRTLFEAIDSGFCIIEMIFGKDGRATDYRFVEANPAFERQSGLVDAVGHRIREFAPDLEGHWFERYGRVALTGEALHVEGEVAPLGRWFDINAFRVGAPEQRRVAVLFTDISSRRNAEAALRASEEQFSSLLNQAPLGVYLVDGDFIVRQVNPVAMPVFGDIPGGPVGRDFDEVIHILWDKEYADEVVRIFRETLETGVPYVTQERAEHRTDRDVIEYYEWRLDRIILPDGRYGVVCYFRDISAQVQARKEIEKANELARESEERFRLAIDGSKIAIYECDLDLRYTWITNPVEGFTPDDIIGRLDRDLLSEKDAALLERFKRQALASEQPLEEEMHASPGGEARWFLMRAERLVDARGKVVGLRVVSLDITESKRTEAARRESEDRLRLIVESAQDYAIFTTDPDDVIDEWMPGAAAVFGFTKEEAEGQPGAIIFTPEDREQGQPEKEIETARREGKAANVRWHIRKDGELVFIEGQVVPLRDAGGGVHGFLKIGQDVTERRLAEAALRDSEERFRQFGEASSDLLWIRDAETLAFEYLSPAFERLYGVPREQVLASNDVKAWAELIHPDDREIGLDVLRKLRLGVPSNSEFRVVRPDGSVRWLHDTNFPLRDDSGKVVRIAGIAQDVTERKRALELQGTLVAELQHRVRNILAMIQAVVRRTRDTSDSAEEYARHLGGRIAAMARTQALLTRSAARQVDLEEVLRDELLSVAAQEGQYWCEGPKVLLPPKAAEVLTLAIHELATNSVKYGAFSHAGGQIEIGWDTEKRDGQEWLAFEWEESRVPKALFEREGFGTELITRRVPYELRGTGALELLDDGIRARIEFPLVRSNSILETNIPEQLQ